VNLCFNLLLNSQDEYFTDVMPNLLAIGTSLRLCFENVFTVIMFWILSAKIQQVVFLYNWSLLTKT
jgi:hypothetical protein